MGHYTQFADPLRAAIDPPRPPDGGHRRRRRGPARPCVRGEQRGRAARRRRTR